LKVYDILGKEVATLLNGEIESGIQTVSFNAKDLASGIYFYKIDVKSSEGKQSFSETRKMLLMK
ncbi:MAG: T9SS C-terminal target domain-containing protein, partial [Ignavibacteriales bacterium]